MKVAALVMADLERDALGAPSTLAAELAGEPVFRLALRRLAGVPGLSDILLACPAGQEARLRDLAGPVSVAGIIPAEGHKGQRMMRSARAFGRYGWRGGLAGTTVYDEAYDPAVVNEALQRSGADVLLLAAGGAALLDAGWTGASLALLRDNVERFPLGFCQAPPGLAAMAVAARTLRPLLAARLYPGRLLAYQPGATVTDAIHQPWCHPLEDGLIATYRRFLADSPRGLWLCRQIVAQAGLDVDGPTVCRIARSLGAEPWPRELTLELTCRRPIQDDLRPPADRPDLDIESLPGILAGLEEAGDVNVMLAGAGDALLYEHWQRAVAEAARAGPVALSTYGTSLDDATIGRLIDSPLSVVQVNVDALSDNAYSAFKRGCDAQAVWAGIRALTERGRKAGRADLMVVPAMLKTDVTLGEQDEFYDRCLQLTGWGMFVEPGTSAGQWPDRAVVHMAPPQRTACRRLDGRLTVLADGTIAACEEDVLARRPLEGRSALEAWRGPDLSELRRRHVEGRWGEDELCAACEEFHRA